MQEIQRRSLIRKRARGLGYTALVCLSVCVALVLSTGCGDGALFGDNAAGSGPAGQIYYLNKGGTIASPEGRYNLVGRLESKFGVDEMRIIARPDCDSFRTDCEEGSGEQFANEVVTRSTGEVVHRIDMPVDAAKIEIIVHDSRNNRWDTTLEVARHREGGEDVRVFSPDGIDEVCRPECPSTLHLGRVRHDLVIRGVPGLENLEGLENVERLRDLTIAANPDLESLKGLGSLSGLRSLTVKWNAKLSDFRGLKALEGISWKLVVDSNGSLESLSGLGSIVDVTNMRIDSNPQLRSLGDFDGPPHLGILELVRNPRFTDLSALSGTKSAHELALSYNESLETLRGLETLESLEILDLTGNEGLKSLSGLEKLRDAGDVDIVGHPEIPTCEVEAFVEGLESTEEVRIENNGDGECESM